MSEKIKTMLCFAVVVVGTVWGWALVAQMSREYFNLRAEMRMVHRDVESLRQEVGEVHDIPRWWPGTVSEWVEWVRKKSAVEEVKRLDEEAP